jgi:hypothetical protein
MFQAGVSGNPNGRPVGTRNKKTERIFRELEKRGDKDPADFLSSIVTNEGEPKDLRVRAPDMLLPYKYGKMGTIPPPRFVEEPIEVPDFQTVEEAEDFLADIAKRAGAGELELQSATDVSNLVRNWLLSKHARTGLDLKVAASGANGDSIIHIVGGLPTLPGCEKMIMPDLGAKNGHELPAPSPAEPTPTESVPQETQDGE